MKINLRRAYAPIQELAIMINIDLIMPIIRLIGQLIELIEIIGYHCLLLELNVIILQLFTIELLRLYFLRCLYVPKCILL